MNKTPLYLLLIILIINTGFYLSTDPFISKIKGQLEKLSVQFPQEKIYVQTDRSIYIAGEDIWLKVYLREANSLFPTEISTVAYVELIDKNKKILIKKNIFIEKGSGVGDIELPLDLATGDYTLRAYSNFMRNYETDYFFKKSINIIGAGKDEKQQVTLDQVENIAADFFPEGGDLVDGIASRVGFKVVDKSSGNGIPVSGKILDKNEKTVAYLKTIKFGLGIFNFTPEISQQYIAEIEFKSRIYKFPLPKVQSKGYAMQVSNRDVDDISIQFSTNVEEGIKGLYLVGKMRGELFYAGKLDAPNNTAKITVSKDSLPDGIAQLTLFSAQGEPLCERLVFVERPENKHVVTISSDKTIYQPKEKVNMEVAIRDFQKELVEGDLVVSVSNSEFTNQQLYTENIKSWMLLNSDLKGKIEQPGFYFSDEKKSTKYLLDVLLMTQGWRRFTWKQLAQEDFPKIEHLPEIGFNIKGHVTRQSNDKRTSSNVYLSVMNEQFQFEEMETDALGNFFFPNLHFFDSTALVLQARKPFSDHEKQKKKKKNEGKLLGSKLLDIHLDENKSQDVDALASASNSIFTESQVNDYLNQYERLEYEKDNFDGWDIELSDVVVKAKRKRKDMAPLELLDNSVKDLNRRYLIDSLVHVPNSVLQILTDNPKVKLSGPIFQETVNMPIILDDVLINQELNMSIIHSLSVEQIYLVDVYDYMTNYHSPDGLPSPGIVIYTRAYLGKGSPKGDGIFNITHPGYYKAREFYIPPYEDKTYNKQEPDYRNTLYWNPNLKNANNEFSFFTSQEIGDYEVMVEGMTKRGVPVLGRYRIQVE